ncbi:MAG: hypothetical protein AABX35_04135 [Nanoarchaeota archaeon]
MIEVRKYEVKLEEMQDYFRNFTLEQLARYNKHVHGEKLVSIAELYLCLLNQAVREKRYPIFGDKVNVSHQGEIITGYWKLPTGAEIEFYPQSIPTDILTNLQDERDKALSVFDGFKKINWGLDRKLNPASKSEKLNFDLDESVLRLHNSLIDISQLHQSERNRAFVMDSPEGPSLDSSNKHRNSIYDFVDVSLEKKKHPLIDYVWKEE